jgi:hypothetical protein
VSNPFRFLVGRHIMRRVTPGVRIPFYWPLRRVASTSPLNRWARREKLRRSKQQEDSDK